MPDANYSETVKADGTATITVQPTKNRPWNVTQVSTELTNPPRGVGCKLKKNGSLVTVMVGAGDVADGYPPIFLRPGDRMTVEWTGATAGQLANALVIYEETDYS